MDFSMINWLALPVCVVFSMLNGSIWYSPKVMFKPWWAVIGKGEEVPKMEKMGLIWALTIFSSGLNALFVGFAVQLIAPNFGGISPLTGLLTGLFLWGGFVAPIYLVNKLFAGHGFTVWAIEVGNHLINFLAFGLIFGAWK